MDDRDALGRRRPKHGVVLDWAARMIVFIGCCLCVSGSGIGTCQSLVFSTTLEALNSTCHSVVDYQYYLPPGVTEPQLNARADSKLNDARLSILQPSCLIELKRLVCGSVYLKCVPGLDFSDLSTYNYAVYNDVGLTLPIPFQRPCRSLCSVVTASASVCWGLLPFFGAQPNCSALMDYSNGAVSLIPGQFGDLGEDCNGMNGGSTVASTKEIYISQKNGACAGLTTELYVPPAQKILVGAVGGFAPLQVPFQMQLIMETFLRSIFTGPSTSVEPECFSALRKLFCAKVFMKPTLHHITETLTAQQLSVLASKGVNRTGLSTSKIYVPSYPAYDLCTSYLSQCPISLTQQSIFAVNCSAMVSGVRQFPSTNQTVGAQKLTVPGTANTIALKFTTAPNTLAAATVGDFSVMGGHGNCSSGALSRTGNYTCSDVVDYDYYVPFGKSLQILEDIVNTKLNNTKLSILPSACLVALKKLVCSSVYLKCQPGISMSNPYSWNFDIYNDVGIPFPVPVQRPCVSVCNDANAACFGLLSLLHVAPDCSATFDYSGGMIYAGADNTLFPYQFDQSNDTSKCNSVPAVFEVASSKEVYRHVHDGFCAGITEDVWLPPGSIITQQFPNASNIFAVNPPYVIQDFIESKLRSQFALLPVYLSSECHFALRKYFCGKTYLYPYRETLGGTLRSNGLPDALTIPHFTNLGLDAEEILNFEFFLPSYPVSQVCRDYETHCASFLYVVKQSITESSYDAIVPRCNATSNGIELFPSSNQTIMAMSFAVGSSSLSIEFTTPPQSYSNASDRNYEPVCPRGFVIPEEPDNIRTRTITGTGCAVACYE
jgi:hypothetical protein